MELELALLIAICVVTGFLAARKGYGFFYWVLAGGVIGLLILAFLPFVNEKSEVSDSSERKALRKRCNAVGGTISAVGLLAMVAVLLSTLS